MADAEFEARLVAHLRARHGARAIVVVGSRADGAARPGSDWDVYALVDGDASTPALRACPETFEGEALDVGVVRLPVQGDAIALVFGPNLQQARVLLDDAAGSARALCAEAAAHYARGFRLAPHEREERRLAFARNLARMRARADDPGAFFEAVAWLFYVAHRWWYELRHGRYSHSVHRALPEIAAADPDFHWALLTLVESRDSAARIAAAEAIERALFGADAPLG